MTYKETEASKMLKQCNDLIYSTTRKLFKTKSQNVKGSLQATLKFLNKAADEYALKRQEEIEAERSEPITLSNGLIVPKGRFIDTQRMYELDDEETENYIIISTELRVNIFL